MFFLEWKKLQTKNGFHQTFFFIHSVLKSISLLIIKTFQETSLQRYEHLPAFVPKALNQSAAVAGLLTRSLLRPSLSSTEK